MKKSNEKTQTGELATVYNPQKAQSKWYEIWEEGGYFKPRPGAKGSCCLIMPPPNVTGRLHAGHALNLVTQDALIRFKRMKGFTTLFLPGMDHAGIATQNVVEKLLLKEKKKSRHDFTREEFVQKIWQWKEKYGGFIAKQQRSLGASADWDYSLFTMDAQANEAVRKAFVSLYNEGLIFRANYIVNWDTQLQSAISDAEVEHREVAGAYYHIRYKIDGGGFLEVATTRPETLLGDSAVSVHPNDMRYQHLIGKNAIVPLCNRKVPIIADEYVDMEKGTGCLKVTPGHDFNDFEIGLRHKLPVITILQKDGTLNEQGLTFKGLGIEAARKKVVEALEQEGLLVKTEHCLHQVGHGDRTGSMIEPLVSKQWFLNIQKMAQTAVEKIEDDTAKFFPKSWENTYFSWLREPKNWCLSRQLWWGHRIPVFSCGSCEHEWAAEDNPTACPSCGKENIEQDQDVLDTWFSSSLWPFSTLGWPDKKRMAEKKFDLFFPTSCVITGYDIIFFWVARMMMMSLKFFDKVPFKHIYIHGIVRDKLGRKMSKSLGNGIDPLDMVEQYGADAFRFTLAAGAGHNRGLNLDPERIGGYRNFINKIWNAFRFIYPSLEGAERTLPPAEKLHHHEKWILSELSRTAKIMNEKIEEYRYDDACSAIYSFVYDKFCSWFIEISKGNLSPQRAGVLRHTLRKMISLLHPFAPFITEELWSHLKEEGEDLLIVQDYPEYERKFDFPDDCSKMNKFIEIVTAARNLRAHFNIPHKEKLEATLSTNGAELASYFEKHADSLKALAKLKNLTVQPSRNSQVPPQKGLSQATSHSDLFLSLAGVDLDEQKKRLRREAEKAGKDLEKYRKKLANQEFLANAPAEVVAKTKGEAADLQTKIDSIAESLRQLP